MNIQKNARDYSLDALRILCMFMIVTLHFISHGGTLEFFSSNEISHYIILLFRSASICSVNTFVLISGYFMVSKNSINLKRLFSVIFAILFYSWLYMGINVLFLGVELDIKSMLSLLFPISYKAYWFPTCYLFLYIISPFLNNLIRNLSLKSYRLLLVSLFVLFSISNELLVMSDPFSVENGYSIAWFIFLYFLAGYIKLYGFKRRITRIYWTAIYIICVILIFCADGILEFLSNYLTIIIKYDLIHHFSRYCSILVLVASVSLFMSFREINVKNTFVVSFIKTLAPLTFGIYLIHDNFVVRNFLYFDLFKLNTLPHNLIAIPIIFLDILLVFVGAALIEWCRSKLFLVLEKSKKYNAIVDTIQHKLNVILIDDQNCNEHN